MTANRGTWSSNPTLSHRWIRCNADGTTGCVFLHEDNAFTHVLVPADVGKVLKLRVLGTALLSSREVDSAATPVIAAIPPSNTQLPTIDDQTPTAGVELHGTAGTWTGTPPIDFDYQWQRCDPGPCADIPGATGLNYTPDAADIGSTLRLRERATGSQGPPVDAFSLETGAVASNPPVNTTLPSISGTFRAGQTLSSTTGTWSGPGQPFSFERQWRLCDASGANCSDIAGETGPTYQAAASDIGSTLRVRVTATGSFGEATVDSTATPVIAPDPPVNDTLPSISGNPRAGQTLTGADGSWSGPGQPFSFQRQWLRCNASGSACAVIPGATGTSLPLALSDVGSTFRFRVTATGDFGSATVESNPTAVVQQDPPVNDSLPSISGDARAGQTLTGFDGNWSGPGLPFSFQRQWLRCNASGGACAAISGATLPNYTLVAADIGSTVRWRVTATSSFGATTRESAPTDVIDPDPPVNTADPTISGTARDGELLSGDDGDWTAPGGPPQFLRAWQRCATDDPASCTNIPGAGALTYQLTSQDVGNRVRLLVAVFGEFGFATEASAMTDPVEALPPVNASPPEVLGTTRRGEELTASPGFWTGSSPITFGYLWQRCSSADPASCTDIPFAGAQDYTLTTDDVGMRVRARVLADNPAPGTAGPAFSALSDVVLDHEGSEGPSLLSPFPRIAISGRFDRMGVKLRLFRIRGEAGATVTLRCRGRGCPFRRARARMRTRTLRIRRLERRLRAGMVIQVFIAKPGKIGKYTRFKIRRSKAPKRHDACLQPGSSRPSKCPA